MRTASADSQGTGLRPRGTSYSSSGPPRMFRRTSIRRGDSILPDLADLPLDASPDEGDEAAFTRAASAAEVEAEDSVSDLETSEEPAELRGPRRNAVSAEAYGAWNLQRAEWRPAFSAKTGPQREGLLKALQACPFFQNSDLRALEDLADGMPVVTYEAGACIIRQGEQGDSAFVILNGIAEVRNEGDHMSQTGSSESSFVRLMPKGRLFGEMSMLWSTPRTRSVYAKERCELGKLTREAYQNLVVRQMRKQRESREECLRKVGMLETLNDEQVAQIADALVMRVYQPDEVIVKQGEPGNEFFVVLEGECVVEIETGDDIQEHRRYGAGDLFGERALLQRTRRAATVTAKTRVEVVCLRRSAFERMLGPLELLHSVNYLHDPRKRIANFFQPGDERGPRGVIEKGVFDSKVPPNIGTKSTEWFAVYRPTSRDAIAKMLSGTAVGKGLNVKGKSAKKNRLSGFVPFLQISSNSHKRDIEESPADARVQIYYSTQLARESVLGHLTPILDDHELDVADRHIYCIDKYVGIYGLDIPEPVMREAYIMRPDISFLVGWETGRQSEPAFMNMNLHALRGKSKPKVVLHQFDEANPMNPQGLLIAYAESTVKPVVSDFDTFTVGSKGMQYLPLVKEQAELALWALEKTMTILRHPSPLSWSTRWLEVLRHANEEGFHPHVPEYGFGDPTSQMLIKEVVKATSDSGAVRHGAECFNFYFPQELDAEYLVVWHMFDGKPWAYMDEDELRDFLLARIEEGYAMPLNPIWVVRDEGWHDVFDALLASPEAQEPLKAWYPPESGIMDQIKLIHDSFPEGFHPNHDCPRPTGQGGFDRSLSKFGDLDICERMDLATTLAESSAWAKVRGKVRLVTSVFRLSGGKSRSVCFAPGTEEVVYDALADTGASPDG